MQKIHLTDPFTKFLCTSALCKLIAADAKVEKIKSFGGLEGLVIRDVVPAEICVVNSEDPFAEVYIQRTPMTFSYSGKPVGSSTSRFDSKVILEWEGKRMHYYPGPIDKFRLLKAINRKLKKEHLRVDKR